MALHIRILALSAFFSSVLTLHAHADTYQIYALHRDQGYTFYGLDDSGDAAVYDNGCAPTACYYTFTNGVSTGVQNAPPTFIVDNGTPCSPTVSPSARVFYGVCNGARDAFTANLSGDPFQTSIYAGPNQTLVARGGESLVFLNSLGDIVWDDSYTDTFYEAFDLTTRVVPEPSAFVLLTTGLVGLTGLVRRRRRSAFCISRRQRKQPASLLF